jgi:hypothetical protein
MYYASIMPCHWQCHEPTTQSTSGRGGSERLEVQKDPGCGVEGGVVGIMMPERPHAPPRATARTRPSTGADPRGEVVFVTQQVPHDGGRLRARQHLTTSRRGVRAGRQAGRQAGTEARECITDAQRTTLITEIAQGADGCMEETKNASA